MTVGVDVQRDNLCRCVAAFLSNGRDFVRVELCCTNSVGIQRDGHFSIDRDRVDRTRDTLHVIVVELDDVARFNNSVLGSERERPQTCDTSDFFICRETDDTGNLDVGSRFTQQNCGTHLNLVEVNDVVRLDIVHFAILLYSTVCNSSLDFEVVNASRGIVVVTEERCVLGHHRRDVVHLGFVLGDNLSVKNLVDGCVHTLLALNEVGSREVDYVANRECRN